ncbi:MULTISPECIES: hypothetical protein [unclassified Endozoicomonas]|uniref:hypothetical protein n=2 Tax=Endozoicomonas TaxID=305899 RepID=UPI00214941C0|nr:MULTISPECIES: hypothetical protein [unclassified Endozoicomonas]
MRFILFGFLLLLHLFQACNARDVYKSILWEYDFYSHADNKSITVHLNSEISIICPNLPTVVKKRSHDRQTSTMYENIWLTSNATDYENCEVGGLKAIGTNKPIDRFICNKPNELIYLNLLFLEHAAGADDRTFEGGKNYYIFSTSDGTQSSVYRRKGGHCSTHNMRLKIYVCMKGGDPDPNCKKGLDPNINRFSANNPFTPAPFATLLTEPLTDPVTTTVPAVTTDSDAETVSTNTTEKAPVIMTGPYTASDSDTDSHNDNEAVRIIATETASTRFHHSLAEPIQLLWEIGYNQTQTAYLTEEENYPVIALCREPNTRISLLNNKGTIVDSWLCRQAGEHLTILKSEYRNGETYLFEALPEYERIRVWKSSLSVNVGGFQDLYISKATPHYNPPALALLISMYLFTASVL